MSPARPAAARRAVGLLLLVLAGYFALIGWRGVVLVEQSSWALKVFGVAVLALPLLGCWVVVAEVRFGIATQRLAARVPHETPDLARLPSGRVDRAAADGWFEQCRVAVEADEADWRRWFRLAEAYDLAGDRRRAREAMRTAIALAGAE